MILQQTRPKPKSEGALPIPAPTPSDENLWPLFHIPRLRIEKFLRKRSHIFRKSTILKKHIKRKMSRFSDFPTMAPLHLNVGIPGIETVEDPVEEGFETYFIAHLTREPFVPTIVSGEMETARHQGLISEKQMQQFHYQLNQWLNDT